MGVRSGSNGLLLTFSESWRSIVPPGSFLFSISPFLSHPYARTAHLSVYQPLYGRRYVNACINTRRRDNVASRYAFNVATITMAVQVLMILLTVLLITASMCRCGGWTRWSRETQWVPLRGNKQCRQEYEHLGSYSNLMSAR